MRYQSKGNTYPPILMSGAVFLKYEDEEAITKAAKGDIFLYLDSDGKSYPLDKGNYWETGSVGYFKAEVFDGKGWKPLNLSDFFEDRTHHFSKTECPIDTYALCKESLVKMGGTKLMRTYREHYVPEFSE